MGLCFPWQQVHKEYRAQFAEAWGFDLCSLASLHGKMEDTIEHISTLATYAHHHQVAINQGCPTTWGAMQDYKFTLEAPHEGPRSNRLAGRHQIPERGKLLHLHTAQGAQRDRRRARPSEHHDRLGIHRRGDRH
eukprot:6961429-Pyramimonas_sp.AAC.1